MSHDILFLWWHTVSIWPRGTYLPVSRSPVTGDRSVPWCLAISAALWPTDHNYKHHVCVILDLSCHFVCLWGNPVYCSWALSWAQIRRPIIAIVGTPPYTMPAQLHTLNRKVIYAICFMWIWRISGTHAMADAVMDVERVMPFPRA